MARPCNHPAGEPQPAVCAVCRKYVESEPHRIAWDQDRPKREPGEKKPTAPDKGVGTTLESLLKSIGIDSDKEAVGGCQCKAMLRRMNAWGVGGCKWNRAEIVAHLDREWKARGWLVSIGAGLRAIVNGLAFRLDLGDLMGSLVDEAIRRHEKDPAPAPPPAKPTEPRPAKSGRKSKTKHLPEPAPDGAIVVEHGAGGIGDGLLGLVAVARLKYDHPDTHVRYQCGSSALPFVRLFVGYDSLTHNTRSHSDEPVAGTRSMNVGYKREHANAPVTRWERYARNIGAAGTVIPELRDREAVRAAGAKWAGRVILCPYSTDRTREWSVHHWQTLEGMLKRAGYRPLVVHNRSNTRLKSEALAGGSAEVIAGAMLGAVCVIGSDSGLAHLAGILGVPTVVLGGSTTVSRIFGVYPRARRIQGGLSCSGCGGSGMDMRCNSSCANLQSIGPERVMAEVDQVWLKDTLTAGRSLVDAARLAVIRDAVLATNHLPGETAELGVYLGGVSRLILHYSPAAHHAFDTFAGIPTDDQEAGGHQAGEFAAGLDDVRAYLASDRVRFHVGEFPATTPDAGERYRFVHLDGDTYQSTAAGLDYFGPRMVPGGVIVLDDYGWHRCPGVARALHERFHESRIERSGGCQAVVRF